MTVTSIIFFMTCWWYAGKYLRKLMNKTIRLPPILKTLAADGVTYFIVQVLAFPLVNSPLGTDRCLVFVLGMPVRISR